MKSLIKHIINILLFLFFLQLAVYAQNNILTKPQHYNADHASSSQMKINNQWNPHPFYANNFYIAALEDTINSGTQQDTFIMSKSPWTAVLLSAVVPGLGQIYNGSYLKVPVIWGLGFGLSAAWAFNNDRYWRYANLYAGSNFRNSNQKSLRDFYRDQRDLISIYMGIAYFLNLVDAYVDAHLFDFTVEEDFQINQTQLGFRINF